MNNRNVSRGFTLVEILIATLLTLVVMGAMVEVFDRIGTSVAESRSALEMADRIRVTRDTLQDDLANLTCPVVPWTRPEAGVGYFELVEGTRNAGYGGQKPTNLSVKYYGDNTADLNGRWLDSSNNLVVENEASLVDFRTLGDFDDILMFTVKSRGEPFVGHDGTQTIRSDTAEVIWHCVENPADRSLGEPGLRTIFRRVRLVAPWAVNDSATVTRRTLGELTNRENRTLHGVDDAGAATGEYPFALNRTALLNDTIADRDVMLTNVLAFDVRVFDPTVIAFKSKTFPAPPFYFATPEDPQWYPGTGAAPFGDVKGAYVDLGFYMRTKPGQATEQDFPGSSHFSSGPHLASYPANAAAATLWKQNATFDTWSYAYENDGLDQDGTHGADQGTDGFDTDTMNGVDDVGERETSPPYPVALRGVQVSIRVLEPDSGQIRQVSVVQRFADR